MDASIISTILVRKLFENNKENFTSNKPDDVVKAVVFVEEAQNVLSEEFVKSNANPFVRVAKEREKIWAGLSCYYATSFCNLGRNSHKQKTSLPFTWERR